MKRGIISEITSIYYIVNIYLHLHYQHLYLEQLRKQFWHFDILTKKIKTFWQNIVCNIKCDLQIPMS